jgi:hypothetical protein
MIAIKEMEKMPETCSDCDLCHGHICKLTGIDIVANPKCDCPLTEIVTCNDCKYCVMTEVGCYCDRHVHRLDTHFDKYCADAERNMQQAPEGKAK